MSKPWPFRRPSKGGWRVVLTRTVPCPLCKAPEHVRCVNLFGVPRVSHRARVDVAAKKYGKRRVA